MTLLTDNQIIASKQVQNSVQDKVTNLNGLKILSYGIEPHGYTVRLGEVFSLDGYTLAKQHVDARLFYKIFPGETVKVRAKERFNMRLDTCGLIYPKSTYVRQGLIFNTAVIDAGYQGHLEFTIFNPTNLGIDLFTNEGLAQIVFFQSEEVPFHSYDGAYQNDKHLIK